MSEADLFRQYLPMVSRVVNKLSQHRPTFMEREDLVQDGMIGLLQAIRSLQSDYMDEQFSAYAYRRIYGAIVDRMRETSIIPRTAYWDARQTQKAASEDYDSVTAIALSLANAVVAAHFGGHEVFDDQIHGEENGNGPEEYLIAVQAYLRVCETLNKMSARQREVFVRCMIGDETQAKVAFDLAISPGRVSQIINRVSRRLKEAV